MATFFYFLFMIFTSSIIDGAQLILVNNCNENIWPGILRSAEKLTPKYGGFLLSSGQEVVIDMSEKWSGRIWARQGCNFDSNGRGACETRDCAGQLQCRGMGGVTPATIVEMTLGTSASPLHFYDVSIVDGFNLPVSIAPVGGRFGVASCGVDLNVCYPSALEERREGRLVGVGSDLESGWKKIMANKMREIKSKVSGLCTKLVLIHILMAFVFLVG